ncbi:MAG: NAD-dependent epimerase/dehydratase family protein [Bacteriovoracaceae bacterium]
MAVVIVTGSAGLIGSEAVKFFHEKGFDVVGIDNDLRKYFFGDDASTSWNRKKLEEGLPRYTHHSIDIRNLEDVQNIFKKYGSDIKTVIHTAAQPSHDWAAREPLTDYSVNATGTMNLLEATREICPDAAFIFTSTNKVYGDTPNFLPLVEKETRYEVDEAHAYFKDGIDESMSIDQCKHSLFGASKAAADLMVQEYGRYFGLKTGTFRGGCLTGPAHSGAELHGFLAYLVKCVVTGKKYTIFGYKGKQVRDNIHSFDLVSAFWEFSEKPRSGEVYNIGGSRFSNCSMLEAITMSENFADRKLDYTLSDDNRIGDHIWWISDVNKFKSHYPNWDFKYDIETILKEIVEATIERERN